jgi:site-specific DNA recombinase
MVKRGVGPTFAVAYTRVSTDDQSLGPRAQQSAVERWATTHGLTVVATFEDRGVSGGAELDKRPGLLAAIRALKEHGAGVLLVARRDRLARDVIIAAAIERLVQQKRARVVSADGAGNVDGPEGMLMRGLVDLFAQYERALICSRTKAALGVKKARGERVGQVPFGFGLQADGRSLASDPVEQVALARIHELRAQGFSIRAITDSMNAEGVPALGERWHATTVGRLLARETAA